MQALGEELKEHTEAMPMILKAAIELEVFMV
jgi:hypothetical protein